MNFKKTVCAITVCILLSSCAGVFFRTDAQTEFEKGLAYFNQGKYKDAIPLFQKATELDTNFGRAYLYLGRSFLNLRNWAEAIVPLRTAFRLSPDESRKEVLDILLDALLGAAVSEVKKGNFLNSINYLKEGIELSPQSSQIGKELVNTLLSYGGSLLSEGKPEDAISVFSEALKLSPDNPDAFVGLARDFFKSGDMVNAIQTLQKALEADPGNDAARSLFKQFLR